MKSNRSPLYRAGAAVALFAGLCRTVSAADATVSNFAATVKGTTLHVTADADPPSTWANTQVMIDADGDPQTGYAGGYDVMIEGVTAYRFKGTDPAAWSWDKAGTAPRKVDGKTLAVDIDLSLLPARSPTAKVLLRALSADYQTVLAAAPAAPGAKVDLSGNAAAAPPTPTPAGGAKAATFSASALQDGTDLVIKVAAASPADLNTVLVFFDTDGDAATGFAPPADPRFGFEAMIQGASLSRHAGATRDAWAWTTLSAVKSTVSGSTAELRFNASLLKGKAIKMSAWQMSPDWQSRTDFFPRAADGRADTLSVPLDATKLRAAASPEDVPVAPVHANANLPARERFAAAKSYACYYGVNSVGPLSHVDAAILHTPAQTPDNVKRLSQIGVVTIGYISVGEDETLRVANGNGYDGKASWYFDKDHDKKPDANGTWGSYYANAADPAWRDDRVAEAKRLCGDSYGFDGIFLDTIETVDAYPESRAGMIKLVEALRAALPDKVIVINRGFSLLKEPLVSGNIDGLMYESFSESYDFDSKSYVRFQPQDMDATRAVMVSTVMPAMKAYKLRVLALDYCLPEQTDRIQEAFDRAVTFGMLPAVAPISLDSVYDTAKVVGQADEKYLAIQATPVSMQTTLSEPRNGFPAGTIIQPSSCFMGYTVATLVDGIADHNGMNWAKAAWASAEQAGVSQQLLLMFPQAVAGGTLEITFAYDNKSWHASRDFTVEGSSDGSAWQPIAHPTSNTESTYRCTLPGTPFRQLRVVQSPGGGAADRPDLMWVQQLRRMP